jgi:outer membrane protein assembly factor BamB
MSSPRILAAILIAAVSVSGCARLGIGGGGKEKSRTPVIGQRVAVLTSESGAEADPALAGLSVLLPPATVNDGWVQPGGNASKSMEHLAVGTALGKAWTAGIRGTTKYERLAASPIVAEGKLFIVDIYALLTAFDAASGAKLWTAQIGDAKDAAGGISILTGEMSGNKGSLFGGGVSYDGGVLYAANGLGDVEAIDPSSGKRKWKVRPAGPARGAPGVGNGNVYVMTQDNQLIALNQADGTVAWTTSAAVELAGVFGTASPASAQGTVVAGFSSGELNAYRYENGRPLWGDVLSKTSISTSVSSLSDIDADPVIDRGRVFAVGQGGRMVSMDLVTGQRIWEINIAGIATPWVAGEWVFVIDDQARLHCIARSTGKVRWISQLQHYRKEKKSKKKGPIYWVGPVLAGDRLILANSEGQLVNVSPADGQVQSKTKVGAGVSLSPIVANNMLYILDDSGRITAFR